MAIATARNRVVRLSQVLATKKPKRHQIAEAVLYLKGRPLSLKKYQLFCPLYDCDSNKTMFMTGRQVSKSTTLSNIMTLSSCFRNFYNTLYLAPLKDQVYKFSNLYVKPLLQGSPLLKQNYVSTITTSSVLVRELTNGSTILFGYVQNGVDRIRGISVDEINWDEVQDINAKLIPIADQCKSASKFGFQRFCGTPKTFNNTMHWLWKASSQNMWIVKCEFCGFQNIPSYPGVMKMIGKDGPICQKCSRLLNVANGEWVPAVPERHEIFAGYHVPQIVVPANLRKRRWVEIYDQFCGPNKYSEAQFVNEVLGLSFDTGGQIITMSELKKLCILDNYGSMTRSRYKYIIAGVDWGISNFTSFTVLIILGINSDGKADILYSKKYVNPNPVEQIYDIAKQLRIWQVDLCGVDFGVGYTNNEMLKTIWMKHQRERVCVYQYAKQNRHLVWNQKIDRYVLSRTWSINQLFFDLKKGIISFPKFDDSSQIFDDILNVHEEINESSSGKYKVFRHDPDKPDDFLHALNFAYVTARRSCGLLVVDYKDDNPFPEFG